MPNQRSKPGHPRLSRFTIMATLLLLASSFAAPEPTIAEPGEPPLARESGQLPLDELRAFSDVYTMIRNNYVDEISGSQLLDAALLGMVGSLDTHSAYLPPEAFQAQDDSARGREGGIGVVLEIDAGRLRVNDVIPDSPAWREGVQTGDLVLAVDGRKVRGRRLQRSMAALAGPPGSTVTVRFRSGGMPPRDLTLQRAYVPARSVRGELLPGNIAVLTLERFHLATTKEFERRLKTLADAADQQLAGIVVDLRGNLGGVIKPAAEIADGFLDEGMVVYTRGRYPASRLEYRALPGQWAPGVPLVILVDGQSASASEILAAALRDHERALIVGSRTYGKGTVQSVVALRNGSALKLTTARYYTPSGRTFDGSGIEPDVVIEPSPEARDPDTQRPDDAALERALELLRRGEVRTGGAQSATHPGSDGRTAFRTRDEPAASVERG